MTNEERCATCGVVMDHFGHSTDHVTVQGFMQTLARMPVAMRHEIIRRINAEPSQDDES